MGKGEEKEIRETRVHIEIEIKRRDGKRGETLGKEGRFVKQMKLKKYRHR